MKATSTGILCVCLILSLGALTVCAQEPPAQPANQENAKQDPAPQQGAAKQQVMKQEAPKPISVEPLTNNPDGVFSVDLHYFQTNARATLTEGLKNTDVTKNSLVMGKLFQVAGLTVSAPGGGDNTFRFSYLQGKGHSTNTITSTPLNFYSVQYDPGDFLVADYNLRHFKVSYDFLTWPNPPETAKLRIKTLWEVQGTWMRNVIDAPFKPIVLDSSGNPISNTAIGTSWFVSPELGLGLEYAISKHWRVEARGSGFAFPHRWTIWEAEARLAFKVSHYEAFIGARGFHFKTSPKQAQFGFATMDGAVAGIIWYPHR